MNESLTITTDGGTTFTVGHSLVVITRHDQPECVIPLADLREFMGLMELEEDDGDARE